ncbi:PIG-L family deacetylase [Acidobacteria bacterium AB60]|nr:PIG-L family deacetylase [Acidobacteria bacterium AB60]
MNLESPHKLRLSVTLIFLLFLTIGSPAEPPGKVLLVVAHPDDEYYFAATVYRLAVQLGGIVDELIITDGEGGFRYSTLAEPYYKKTLTIERIGRRELPRIRKREAINAGRVLGIHKHFFLNQEDEYFTDDVETSIAHWDSERVVATIAAKLKKEHYTYVFSILPRATMHGGHQAATILTTEAIDRLPGNNRPVLLGFDTDDAAFEASPRIQETQRWPATFTYAFDRTVKFGFHDALSYQIVVDWMIAEHKSQGLLQTMCSHDPREYIWVNQDGSREAQSRAGLLFRTLAVH